MKEGGVAEGKEFAAAPEASPAAPSLSATPKTIALRPTNAASVVLVMSIFLAVGLLFGFFCGGAAS